MVNKVIQTHLKGSGQTPEHILSQKLIRSWWLNRFKYTDPKGRKQLYKCIRGQIGEYKRLAQEHSEAAA